MAAPIPSSGEPCRPKRAAEFARGMFTGGTLFEEMRPSTSGPIAGHDLNHLMPILRNLRDAAHQDPICCMCVTEKGQGLYAQFAARSADKYNGVASSSWSPANSKGNIRAAFLHQGLRRALMAEAEADERIVRSLGRCPPVPGSCFRQTRPKADLRCRASRSSSGYSTRDGDRRHGKPFCAIYSTFLHAPRHQVGTMALRACPSLCDRSCMMVGADGAHMPALSTSTISAAAAIWC